MRRAALVLTAIVVLGGHAPSGAQTPPAPAAGTGAADVHLVAGTWSGVAHRGQRDDYVELRIRADHTYEMVSARQIGVFRGRGVLVPTARGFELRSERGGVGALGLERDAGGEVILRLEATLDSTCRPICGGRAEARPRGSLMQRAPRVRRPALS